MADHLPNGTMVTIPSEEKRGRTNEQKTVQNNDVPLSSFTLPRNWKHSQTPKASERSTKLMLPHFSRKTSSASGTFNFENGQRKVSLQVISSFATSEEEDSHLSSEKNDQLEAGRRSTVPNGYKHTTITDEEEGWATTSFMDHSSSDESLDEAENEPTVPAYLSLPRNLNHNQMSIVGERSATLPLPHFSQRTSSASGTFNFENGQRRVSLQVISSFATSEEETADLDSPNSRSDSQESNESHSTKSTVSVGNSGGVYKGSYKLRYKTGDTQKRSSSVPNGYLQPVVEQRLIKSLTLPASYTSSIAYQSSHNWQESQSEEHNDLPSPYDSASLDDTPNRRGNNNNVNNTNMRESVRDDIIKKGTQTRVMRAQKTGMVLEERKTSIVNKKYTCLKAPSCRISKSFSTPPSLEYAQYAGFRMMPHFFFPAVPKLIEDIWVILQLTVVFFDFLFNCVTYDGSSLAIFVVSLSSVALLLALLDGIIYFTQGGSLASCVSYVRRKVLKKDKSGQEQESNDDEREKRQCCQFIPNKWKYRLNMWFEVIRTLLSEAILYPLALADLIELVESHIFAKTDAESRINFGLFNIGLFYLIVTIYIMRIIMTISIVVNLRRIPKKTDNNYTHLVIKFCIHLVGQLVVHATILVMNSVKVSDETCVTSDGRQTILSPFLWYTMACGYVLPILGILLFLLLNYPALKMFSIAFYIDIISTVVNDNLGDMVFERGTLQRTKERAHSITEKIDISSVKIDFKEYFKTLTLRGRVFYRLTNSWTLIGAVLYTLLLISFLLAHISGPKDVCDREQGLEIILFKDSAVTVTFFIGLLFTFVANYHAILIAVALFSAILFFVLFVVFCTSTCYFSHTSFASICYFVLFVQSILFATLIMLYFPPSSAN